MSILAQGDIEFDNVPPRVSGVTVHVRIEDVSRADAPSTRLAEQVIRNITLRGPDQTRIPFSVQASIDDPNGQYVLRVHVDLNGSGVVEPGDYVSTQSYPISTSTPTTEMRVQVRRVG